MNITQTPDWRQLLLEALSEPGRMSKAYSMFYRYSFGNIVWVTAQLSRRNLPISPVASFNHWKELGRQVKKGEKALAMLMPRMHKKTEPVAEEDKYIFSGFMVRNHWFSLDQTDGAEYVPDVLAGKWDSVLALETLGVHEEAFAHIDGNCMGYAKPSKGVIAVNPMNPLSWKTRFHELAHCLLHRKDGLLSDDYQPVYSLGEVEAESVAYLCCATLNLPGIEESRGYIQHWMNRTGSRELAAKNIQRIFSATGRILSAGNAINSGGSNHE